MNKDSITLYINSVLTKHNIALGTLMVYREFDESEQEIDVDIEFDYQPYEPETLESPQVDPEVTITQIVDSVTGRVHYKHELIDNLDDVYCSIIEGMEGVGA